jgi:hypothetical protein
MRLVEQAQQSKSRTQILADKAAGWLFYIAWAVAALLTAVAWTVAVGFNVEVVERVATVLVIACPHALGWPSRWWWPSPPRWAPTTASWCATGWRWKRRAIDTCDLRQDRHADQGRVWRGGRQGLTAGTKNRMPWRWPRPSKATRSTPSPAASARPRPSAAGLPRSAASRPSRAAACAPA